jgi:hypothetical protein
MMKIAPAREEATAMRIVTPKLLSMRKVERQRAENPKKVARPETVMAVPIRWTLPDGGHGVVEPVVAS